ncbi:NYN domain-containing protein [uncultured Rikenella sp.]|uniref:NYN domain-containing protein n=1 Tax=uncultured Rikenella sp. TaxID=368003 RepID=UPI00263458D2|nr:NYN domain-containing protein [uncultured Rikenella sp.]
MADIEKQRVIVYVDGFNFYYGLKHDRWRRYYWLDVVSLFEKFMRPNQELIAVKYFSARPTDIGKSERQNAFFQANKENPKFKLILGKYLKKEIECFRCHNIIHTYEEKESDVRIATQIVADAYQKNCDVAIIVSADSDMVPAIELAMEANQKVFIYFPPHQYSNNLATMGITRPLLLQQYESRFKQSLLPDVVHLQQADFDICIPESWKREQ